jgi:8-oxo-dGTP pyrophosphatase MutT (NUDIX family)
MIQGGRLNAVLKEDLALDAPEHQAENCERRLQVAALPWRETKTNGIEVMLITSRDSGRWVLPKGWPHQDEPLCEAAAREAMEEAGIEGTVSSEETGIYRYEKIVAQGEDIPCAVAVFSMKVRKAVEKWPEKRQRKRKWVPVEKAARLVQEQDLAELIAAFGAKPERSAA